MPPPRPSVSRRDRWMYSLLGPSTLHLQHETYLLISLTCLVISSMAGTYKESFGQTSGDIYYIGLTVFWLSRHLWVRWICSWDASTNRSPTLGGVLARWISSFLTAGQFFDRPSRHSIAKQIGTSNNNTASGVVVLDEAVRPTSMLSSLNIPVLNYMGRLVLVWVWYPFLSLRRFMFRKRGTSSSHARSSYSNSRHQSTSTTTSAPSPGMLKAYSIWNNFWYNHGGKFQVLIPLSTLAAYGWYFLLQESSSSSATAGSDAFHALQGQAAKSEDMEAFGAYQKVDAPTWGAVAMIVSCFGTILSILLYGRLLLPVGDLVAGTNVLKAVRHESKNYQSSSGGKSPRARTQKEQGEDISWPEQYKSAAHENRFALFCKTGYIRLVEAVLLCAFFPITTYVCRVTGQCQDELSLSALSRILHFAGISEPLRPDNYSHDQTLLRDFDVGTSFVVLLSSISITSTLLLAQAVTVNRSFLSITGYVAGQWVLVKENDPSLEGASASFWDSRRRYKKGDLVLHKSLFGNKKIYRATSNAPEGRPFDHFLSITHEFLTNELGHQERSDIVRYASWLQLAVLYVVGVIIMIYKLFDYHAMGLFWAFAANAIATFGLIKVGLSDRRELHSLAQQVS